MDGDGFFVVRGDGQSYTRDGSFSLNAANQLVNTSGEYVQGYVADEDGNIQTGQLSEITIPIGQTQTAAATENVKLEGNLNANGALATGASVLSSQLITTAAATVPVGTSLLTDLRDTASGATLFAAGDTLTLDGEKGGRSLGTASFTVTAASTVDELRAFFSGGMGVDETVAVAGAPTPGATLETDAVDPNSARLFLAGNVGARTPWRSPARGSCRPAAPRRSRSPTAPTPAASPATRSARACTPASSPTTRSAPPSPST